MVPSSSAFFAVLKLCILLFVCRNEVQNASTPKIFLERLDFPFKSICSLLRIFIGRKEGLQVVIRANIHPSVFKDKNHPNELSR